MKFSNIKINNFRQYYKTVDFDLSTNEDKNIVVIGGKNGYGKTNFLLSIVWCLYGEKISQIDDNFKKEIQKERNYSQFMKQSLNRTATKENKDTFSIKLNITELDLPQIKSSTESITNVIIKRDFNVVTMKENLSIKAGDSEEELFEDNEDKINFILIVRNH